MASEISAKLSRIAELARIADNRLCRQLLLIEYANYGLAGIMSGQRLADTAVARAILREVPPGSELWAMSPGLAVVANVLSGYGFDAYVDRVVAEQKNRDVCAAVLYNALEYAYFSQDSVNAVKYYQRLTTTYIESSYGALARRRYGPKKNIDIGKSVPRFSLPVIDSMQRIFNVDSAKGSYVLVDFWATWCQPCLAEMQNLHAAYQKYHGGNFRMLSISFDKSAGRVAQFRHGRWKMPWSNSVVADGFDSDIAKQFDVKELPRAILIDPQGKVVAMDSDLRGENLDRTLSRLGIGRP
jgi:thiol-disulfide isomerase/thioredoxin